MDNIYEEIRQRLTMPEVARFYDLEMNRGGFAVCPFHEDKKPSMKIYEDHYHCFGCGAHGDATDFVARLFEISQYDAAKKLNSDFGLNLIDREYRTPITHRVNPETSYHNWLRHAERTLNEYLNMLCRWQTEYVPKNPSEPLHPKFIESLTKKEYCQYLLDQITIGTEQDKRELYLTEQKTIAAIAERVNQQTVAKPAVKRKVI